MKRSGLLTALFILPCIAAAQDPVTIAETIPYSDGIGSDAIRKECDWNTQLSFFITQYAKRGVDVSAKDLDTTKGRVLSMTIVNVHSVGGGGFSGPKWATIKGELRDGGNVIGSFHANRTTTGGGPTACDALNRVGKAIAKDIFVWLKTPTMDAKLGNAK